MDGGDFVIAVVDANAEEGFALGTVFGDLFGPLGEEGDGGDDESNMGFIGVGRVVLGTLVGDHGGDALDCLEMLERAGKVASSSLPCLNPSNPSQCHPSALRYFAQDHSGYPSETSPPYQPSTSPLGPRHHQQKVVHQKKAPLA